LWTSRPTKRTIALLEDSLETYDDYLEKRLALPTEARYCPQEDFLDPSPLRRVNVIGLDREVAWDEEEPEVPEEATWRSVASTLLEITAFAASFGAVVGAAVAVMPWARWAACTGGGVWGVFVAVAQARYAQKDMRFVVPRFQKGFDGVIGLVTGAVQGAFFGIMAVAFIGAVLGVVVGLVLRRLVQGRKWLVLRIFPGGVLFGAACGVTAQAFYMDRAAATNGLWSGGLIGLGSGLFLCLVALPLAFIAVRRPVS